MGLFKKKLKDQEVVDKDIQESSAVPKEESCTEEVVKEASKSGWIYIISNVGSFGPNIYKIGMTKAKDPMSRIKDLSDASVPFAFAVHAFIQVEDAGAAEAQFHRFLRERELNKINHKKEFFNVTLDEIKDITKKLGYKNVKWNDDAVDVQYLKSKLKQNNDCNN